MAAIPTQVRQAIETLLDNISGENCTPGFIVFEWGGWRWKVTIQKSQENEISILIRRQKRY